MTQLVTCPDTFISIPQSLFNLKEGVYSSNQVKFLLVLLIPGLINLLQEGSSFLSFPLFLLWCSLLVSSSWAVYNLHLCYTLFHIYIPYDELKKQYFLFTELKFVEHWLCARQCRRKWRARWVALCFSGFPFEKSSLSSSPNIHSSTRCSLDL